MRLFVFFLVSLIFPSFLVSSVDSFFEDEDPTLYHHVNVISGHLQLALQDTKLKGPVPFALRRTYSSTGPLERNQGDSDRISKISRECEWMLGGGWTLLPEAHLMILTNDFCKERENNHLTNRHGKPTCCYADLRDKAGNRLVYTCESHGEELILRASPERNPSLIGVEPRKNLKNSFLKLVDSQLAILYLPDGGERYYKGSLENGNLPNWWLLEKEVLPSKHEIHYSYSGFRGKKLNSIKVKNPKGDKTFASISFDESAFKTDQKLSATTSDEVELTYTFDTFKERTYLHFAEISNKSSEQFCYEPGRRGTGARFHTLKVGEQPTLKAIYNTPPSKKKEKKWAKKPKKPTHWVDRVSSILFPDPGGDLSAFASFSYRENCTVVEDFEGIITKYFHNNKHLNKIEYHNLDEEKFSEVRFEWDNGHLIKKTLYDSKKSSLFSRNFTYDSHGNITEEKITDHRNGNTFSARNFSYYPETHLVKREEESSGLVHEYQYHKSTDLISSKITKYEDNICLRELTKYDEDNLPIRKVIDDGHDEKKNPSLSPFRSIEEYTRDPENGLVIKTKKKVFDFFSSEELLLSTHHYTYSKEKNCIKEEIVSGNEELSYFLEFEYDNGNLTKKTSPTKREEIFLYDKENRLKKTKTPGSPEKIFTYNALNYPIQCIEGNKTTKSEYDRKGRLVFQTDHFNNTTRQIFDKFGRCIETQLPPVVDENGEEYHPTIEYAYDCLGNLISFTNPNGEKTVTEYNILGKAVREIKSDGSEITHTYHPSGTLATTTLPNKTKISYEYDPFQRLISKKVQFEKEILREESWVYSTFYLLSYTDPLGLTTKYEYNARGEKIRELAADRETSFSYDLMGNLERITTEDKTIVQKHNLEGEVQTQWEEGNSGKIENHMTFSYNQEGQKIKATRITSQGDAEDAFEYDSEGRLTSHTDPLGNQSKFLFQQIKTPLDQLIEQRITVDPLGLSTIETLDANGRVIETEKRDPSQSTVGKTQYFYDKAGNRAKRITYIYNQNIETGTHTTIWEHDGVGRVTKETEQEAKETLYSYNNMGLLTSKTLPSKITLEYRYDLLGRLIEMKSSDKLLHYTYLYGKGDDPIEATDNCRNLTWYRSYNLFGELITETAPQGFQLSWTYDSQGKRTQFTLPDQSSVSYTYGDLHLEKVERNSPENQTIYAHTYTAFDENGHVASEELIHELGTTTTTHDLLERPHRQASPWLSSCITYGPSGLVTSYQSGFFPTKKFAYDPLNQLIEAGKEAYSFDSLGNPSDAEISPLNQIISQGNTQLNYDLDGNPNIEKHPDYSIQYTYDALGRLTSIGEIQYIYDPFNRLYSKQKNSIEYYLYDQEAEIGTISPNKEILSLKVIGLGILGEIGGAVAIELEGKHYLPLHDFAGNISLLIETDGTIVEMLDIDPFGQALTTPSINPWRFSSKRSEENLVFFGKRFYSPLLKRFLTPDPIGQVESPNLYLFVQNSPLNRLDLFGLTSSTPANNIRLEVSIGDVMVNQTYAHCNAYINGVKCDWIVYSNLMIKLKFTPEELANGRADLMHHLPELCPKEGMEVGLSTFMNGIDVPFEKFGPSFLKHVKNTSEDLLQVGMYLPTRGRFKDVILALSERAGFQTKDATLLRQSLLAFRDGLDKVNPKMLMYHTAHSRGSATLFASILGMTPEERAELGERMISGNLGPAQAIPEGWMLRALNLYSKQDGITGPFGRLSQGASYLHSNSFLSTILPKNGKKYTYDIEFTPCKSTRSQRTIGFDHGFAGNTYQYADQRMLNEIKRDFKFYNHKESR